MTSPTTKKLREVQHLVQRDLDQHANMRTQYAIALVGSGTLNGDFSEEALLDLLRCADQLATLDNVARVDDVAKFKAKLEAQAQAAPRIVAP